MASGLLGKMQDGWEALTDFVKNLVQDFRESNRYFKVKAGLISGYVAVSVVTLLVFIPRGELNQIGAELRISKTEIVGGRYFLVTNTSSEDWKDVVLTMNGTYASRWPVLGAQKKKAFFFVDFRDAAGKAPAQDLPPRSLRIECSEGAFERTKFTAGQ